MKQEPETNEALYKVEVERLCEQSPHTYTQKGLTHYMDSNLACTCAVELPIRQVVFASPTPIRRSHQVDITDDRPRTQHRSK